MHHPAELAIHRYLENATKGETRMSESTIDRIGEEIKDALKKSLTNKSFNIIIANTVKGYGIKSIKNNPAWHHKSPTTEELKNFKKELCL